MLSIVLDNHAPFTMRDTPNKPASIDSLQDFRRLHREETQRDGGSESLIHAQSTVVAPTQENNPRGSTSSLMAARYRKGS